MIEVWNHYQPPDELLTLAICLGPVVVPLALLWLFNQDNLKLGD